MDRQETVVPSGQHYSGRHRVPNIKQFMEQLDSEKKERDAAIDSQNPQQQQQNGRRAEVKAHKNESSNNKAYRTVRDPVTGKDVGIADADVDFEQAVENPQVGADNLNKRQSATY